MTLSLFLLLFSQATLGDCIQVEGDSIRASDVPQASHLPPEEVLLRAPWTGARRTVEVPELRRLLRLADESLPLAPICFEQASEVLTVERIVKAMRTTFQGLDVTIRVSDYSLYAVPRGKLEFPRTGLMATPATLPGQRVMWRGRVSAGGRSTPVWARVYLESTRDVLALRRSVEAGERIEADDLILKRKETFPLQARSPLQIAQVAGMAARRRMAAGTEVTSSLLLEPYDVEPRQNVELVVQSDSVRLKMPAVSEGRARTGEFVWLQQTTTGKRLRARVTGRRQATLEIETKNGDTLEHGLEEIHSNDRAVAGQQ